MAPDREGRPTMAEHAESDEVLSKGVLKMIFCRAVDLMGPEPYDRFCPIVCAALGISVSDGMAYPAAETEARLDPPDNGTPEGAVV